MANGSTGSMRLPGFNASNKTQAQRRREERAREESEEQEYRWTLMQQGLSTHRVNRMMQQYRATRNRAKRGGKQNSAARPVPF